MTTNTYNKQVYVHINKYSQNTHTNHSPRTQGELEGSKLYKDLEENARRYFTSHVLPGQANQDGDDLTLGAMVVKLLAKVNVDYEFYKERSTRLVPADGTLTWTCTFFSVVLMDLLSLCRSSHSITISHIPPVDLPSL